MTAGPQTHVLIVGVSDYVNLSAAPSTDLFQLRKLNSAALSGYRFSQWLSEYGKTLDPPLADSVRLLLSATPDEIEKEPALKTYVPGSECRATLANVTAALDAWRNAARVRPDDATLFYFAGHGLQRQDSSGADQVLLLEDFGAVNSKLFRDALEFSSIKDGMVPSIGETGQPSIARKQLYFLDACRARPKELFDLSGFRATEHWDPERFPSENRTVAVYYATLPGKLASGIEKEQSVFNRALIRCLSGDAAEFDQWERRWRISTSSLFGGIARALDDLNDELGSDQHGDSNITGYHTIRWLLEPPTVQISIELAPEEAASLAALALFDRTGTPVPLGDRAGAPVFTLPPPLEPHPYPKKVPGGEYRLRLTVDPERFGNAEESFTAMPPRSRWPIRLTPL